MNYIAQISLIIINKNIYINEIINKNHSPKAILNCFVREQNHFTVSHKRLSIRKPVSAFAVNAWKFHRVSSVNYTVESPLNGRFVSRWITGFSNPLLGNRKWTCEHHRSRKPIRSILSSVSWCLLHNTWITFSVLTIQILFSFFFVTLYTNSIWPTKFLANFVSFVLPIEIYYYVTLKRKIE